MAEFNPNAYLAKTSTFNPDEFLGVAPQGIASNVSAGNLDVPGGGQVSQAAPTDRGIGDVAQGLGEAALTTATGATTGALGFTIGSVQDIANKLVSGEDTKKREEYAAAGTYAPKGESGQEIVGAIGETLGVLPPILSTTPVSTIRAAIPKRRIPKNIMKSAAGKKALLKREIAAGNPNIETLTKALNSEGDIITNKASKAALKTIGDSTTNKELISVLERLDPASKKQVGKMLDVITNKKKFPDLDSRPSDIVGDSVANRARAIATKNESAGKRIGSIANSLKSKNVNIQTPVNGFITELSDLGVTFSKADDGWVTPDFSRSKFVGGNQKDMAVLVNDLLSGDINFQQAHKLKQTIRDNVDFDKGGAGQIKGSSQRLLKKLSSGIDEVLDIESTPYRKANEVFAKTIKLKDDFQKMAGKDIDLFSDLSKEALAGKARRLSSNAQSRTAIKQTLADSDEVLKSLGVNFKDNIHSLNFVVNKLDDLFKVTPETSIQGVIERGVDASFSPMAAAKQGVETVKSVFSASDAKKIASLKELMKTK
ncbi:MAG TPA: hypothetical protein EYN67_01590 [Flavobacteriales bacterium]|nr:hypothetical protein [Flavobacteriales bacterium]